MWKNLSGAPLCCQDPSPISQAPFKVGAHVQQQWVLTSPEGFGPLNSHPWPSGSFVGPLTLPPFFWFVLRHIIKGLVRNQKGDSLSYAQADHIQKKAIVTFSVKFWPSSTNT